MKSTIDNLVRRTGRTQQELADALGVTRPAVWQALHGFVRSSRVFALVDRLSGAAPGTCAALAEGMRRARVEAKAKMFAQCAMAHRAEEKEPQKKETKG